MFEWLEEIYGDHWIEIFLNFLQHEMVAGLLFWLFLEILQKLSILTWGISSYDIILARFVGMSFG